MLICLMNLWKKRSDIVYIVDDYASHCLECATYYLVYENDAFEFKYLDSGT
ncbi:MAG: hypothetical protein ACFFEF_10230 [Candidatus Thorarchaeota archaeon]